MRYSSNQVSSQGKIDSRESTPEHEYKRRKIMDARYPLFTGSVSTSPSKNSPTKGQVFDVDRSLSSASNSPQNSTDKPQKRSRYSITVEEVEDEEAPLSKPLSSTIPSIIPPPTTKPSTSNIFVSKPSPSSGSPLHKAYHSTPRRPSPLRQSVQPETPSPPRNVSGRSVSGDSPPNAPTPVAWNLMNDIVTQAVNSTPKPEKPKLSVSKCSKGRGLLI